MNPFRVGDIQAWSSARLDSWSIIVFFYMNDLHKIRNLYAKLVLFSDGASVIVTNRSPKDFKCNTNKYLMFIGPCIIVIVEE